MSEWMLQGTDFKLRRSTF